MNLRVSFGFSSKSNFGRIAVISLFSSIALIASISISCRRTVDGRESSIPENWNPKPYYALAPTGGVTLDSGVFKSVFDNNIEYLLHSFTVRQMLREFRLRAGEKNPQAEPYPQGFWAGLPGSCAGRFLMGAGNVLRWREHKELRRMMDEVVDGIEACRQPNGFIMAYPEEKSTYNEYGNYVRSWVTQGLIEASIAGNPKALKLVRGFQDWFNKCQYLSQVRNLTLGYQGMIANTRMYFTPVGKPEDILVVRKYYEEDWWLDQLQARDEKAVYARPEGTPHTHCYEVTAWEAYLDLYRATGEPHYLSAVLGGWDMSHEKWIHPGGGFAFTENGSGASPARSYALDLGELCCSVFWVFLNDRLHQMYPELEKYMAEIEQVIYNVGFGNQDGTNGIRYHARLDKKKMPTHEGGYNTCCEGQGTRLYGALPQFIYSTSNDGLYVNLFTPSTITWGYKDQLVTVKMMTRFPEESGVKLRIDIDRPAEFKLHVRVPSWGTVKIPISINGTPERRPGVPGSYYVINRTWSKGDIVSFILPVDFRISKYIGIEQIREHSRYSIQYGPILLAFVGPLDFEQCMLIRHKPEDMKSWLIQKENKPLHFSVKGHPQYECMPYWEVADQTFTCFPIIERIENK